MDIRINIPSETAKTILYWLLSIELFLAIVYLIDCFFDSPVYLIHSLFDMDQEKTVPSWFSSMQLAAIAFVLLYLSKKSVLLAEQSGLFFQGFLFFMLLSMDEALALHERVKHHVQDVEWMPRVGEYHGMWMPFYILGAVFLLLINWKALRAVLRKIPRQFYIISFGFALFVGGGIFLEFWSYFIRDGERGALYTIEVTLEEFLEMFGCTVILYGCLLLLDENAEPTSA